MASAMSKRQQARNERALQDLIRSVPGNDRCADCAAKNPGWASWNLGIFLCMRCAALHRRLGTHISKVKSLSMDSWGAEQVDNMRRTGNVASNKIYNPSNVNPDIPVDIDEVETAMERFIRKKYEQRALTPGNAAREAIRRQNTGSTSTGSLTEDPPALPPKPGKRFGFSLRSSSSTYTRPKNTHFTPPLSPALSGSDKSHDAPSPPGRGKPGHLFGMRITSIGNNFDQKLGTLRDMGFSDDKKNSDVLKSTNGNVDRAVETLIRLGEGTDASRSTTPGPRALTPLSMASASNGISMEKTRLQDQKTSNNPWEAVEHPQRSVTLPAAQAASISPRAQTTSPAGMSNSWNPFLSQAQEQQPQQAPSHLQSQPLDSSLQALSISHSGPAQMQQNNPFQTGPSNPWQTSMAQQQSMNDFFGQPVQAQQHQQQFTAVAAHPTGNPFLRTSRSMTFQPSNPWMANQTSSPSSLTPSQAASNSSGAPYGQQSQRQQPSYQHPVIASPATGHGTQDDFFPTPQPSAMHQQYQQQHSTQAQDQHDWFANAQNSSQSQHNWPQDTSSAMQYPQWTQQNAINPQHQPQTQAGYQQTYQYPLEQQQAPKQAPRHNASSILALYNMPQLAPPRPLQAVPETGYAPPEPGSASTAGKRSATMPLTQQTGSLNPFAQQSTNTGPRHISNESVDFQGFNASGRHSPDAFAGLSSRYMR